MNCPQLLIIFALRMGIEIYLFLNVNSAMHRICPHKYNTNSAEGLSGMN